MRTPSSATRFVAEYPSMMISITPGANDGEFGFDWSTMERTSYDKRHEATDYYGTTQWLWGIGAAVYMSLLGRHGMAEVAEGIMRRAAYAARKIDALAGVSVAHLDQPFFKEFVIDFNDAGKSVAEINASLLKVGIFGGKDLSGEFPSLGQSMLTCVTEVHGAADIDRFVAAIGEAVR